MRARRDAGASTSAAADLASVDRPLLLGEPVCELRRRRDLSLERGPALGRKRAVRERGKFDDLLTGVLVLSTASHGHGNTHGNAERTAMA